MGMDIAITDLAAAWPFVLAIGALVGIAQSVFGLGGGVIMIPFLPMIFNIEPRQAIATSLLTMAPVALINSVRVIRRQEMDISRALRLGSFSMLGSALAVQLSAYVKGSYLLLGFAVATAWMAYQVFFRIEGNRRDISNIWDFPTGLVAGLTSGFTGVSGGVVVVPYLNKVKAVALRQIVPTSIGALCLTSIAGAVSFAIERLRQQEGEILFSYSVVGLLVLGAVLSSQVGLRLQSLVPQRIKLAVLGVLLIGLSVRTFFQALAAS
jgi:uncharacterized membrane protein YfcA